MHTNTKVIAGKARKLKSRGNGQGSAYRYRGRWRWQLREEVNGSLQVVATGMSETRTTAEQALSNAKADRARGVLASNSATTLGEWLDTWLWLRKPHVRETTFEQYEFRLRHIPDHLRKLRLQAVKRSHVLALDADLSTRLGANSRRKVIEHLAAAFEEGIRQELLVRNPASGIRVSPTAAERSKPERRKVLTDDELVRFLTQAYNDPLYSVFYIMFSLGLRCGEALGLRWQDVDFDGREIRIEQGNKIVQNKPVLGDLKTASSRRTIPASPDLLDVLCRHRDVQEDQRQKFGEAWPDTDLVFTTGRGTLLDRHNVQRTIHRLCIRTEIEGFGTHSGRYTNITTRLRAGQLPEVVARIAGHSRVSTTLNIYRKVMPDEVRAAEFSLSGHLHLREAAD